MAVSHSHGGMFVGSIAFRLRRTRVRRCLVVIALFMRGYGLKMVVCGSDMARGGEMVLATRHLDLGVGHKLFLSVSWMRQAAHWSATGRSPIGLSRCGCSIEVVQSLVGASTHIRPQRTRSRAWNLSKCARPSLINNHTRRSRRNPTRAQSHRAHPAVRRIPVPLAPSPSTRQSP